MSLSDIATEIKALKESIVLIYAFNSTGKTQLSVAYKDATKGEDGSHAGVYYNAYSEDLFVWENDEENDGTDICLKIVPSTLSKFHASINEVNVEDKLKPFLPKFKFRFVQHENPEDGIDSIVFYIPDPKSKTLPDPESTEQEPSIKISRGEERIFVWCFFLALFEVDGWADEQNAHFFIDDPISSMDDHNIFVTATQAMELIASNYKEKKIIITTHHFGFFSMLANKLRAEEYKESKKACVLSTKSGSLKLQSTKKDVLLFHLRIMQVLSQANKDEELKAFHFPMLRQALENIASFLGARHFGYVLDQIEYEDSNGAADAINALSHKRIFSYESELLSPTEEKILTEIFEKIQSKYNFKLHAE